MRNLSEHHEYLLLGKITDSLSTDEALEAEALLRDNPEVRLAYERMLQQLPADDVISSFSKLNAPGYWRDLTTEFQEGKTKSSRSAIFKWVAAASVVIALGLGGWLFMKYQQTDINAPGQLVSAESNSKSVQLKLASGTVIDLSAQKGDINAGAAKLSNTDKALSYSVTDEVSDGMNSVTVPIGLDYKITLADGSQVWLNSATKFDFPFKFHGKTREITINGEAYLQVAKNAAKPFIVHLPGSTVEVTGTEFNVNSYDTGTVRVALVEGSVSMKASAYDLKLSPGKEAIYREGRTIEQKTFDPKYVLSWRKGLFYFDEATLQEISQVFPRWFGTPIVIDNPAIKHKKFVGVIDRNKPIAVFQDDLKAISGIDSYIDSEQVLHFK